MTDTALTQQGTPDDELDLTRLLALVWRGKWIILACIAVAFALATFYIREVAVPRYAATTRLVIEAQDRNVVDIESVVSGMSTSTTSINTELSIITSRGMIEKLVRDLELYKDPEFNNAIAQPPRYSRGWIRQQIRALITGETPQVPDQTVEEAVQSSIGRTARAVRATSVSSTLLIDITVTTENRRKSAVIANRLAELYIDAQVENKFNAVEYAIEWLTERVTELERELRDRQSQLDEVRSGASLVGQETLEQMTIRSVELRNRIQNLSSSIEERQARIARAKTLRDTGGGEELVDLFDDRTLSAISADAGAELGNERFSDRVDLLIAQEEQGVARLISQRDVFQESIERLNAELSQQTEALKQVEEMSRNIQASQTLYETFLSRLKETSLQIGLQQADSRILSEAPSGRQVAPQARRLTALSIVFGFLVGVGLVLLRQFTQRGIKTGSELEAVTGQNVIGQIPLSPVKDRMKMIEYLRNKPTSAMAEAIRNLRTSVTLANPKNPPQLIMITSSIPGEGKTTVAVSLALNLAGLGKRVLLIDGDIRRNTLSQYFHSESGVEQHNIVNILEGDTNISDAVLRLPETGIDVLMSEKSDTNAADIFASEAFGRFVGDLRDRYDHIVFDTPPVLAVPDARVVARFADAVLFIVGWNKAHREQVREGIQELRSLGITLTGVVLNQIDGKKMGRYGYGYGGYSKYGSRKYGQGYYDN